MVTTMEGPLAPWASGLAGDLDPLRYARRTTVTLLQLAEGLSCRLELRGLLTGDLTAEVV